MFLIIRADKGCVVCVSVTPSWNLKLAMLHVREGQQIDLLAHPEDSDPLVHTDGFNTDR